MTGPRSGASGAGERTLRVCVLYPDLLNLYADRGNMMVLRDRCTWRGIGFELTSVGLGRDLDPAGHDLYYLGGGQDRDQRICADDLVTAKHAALHAAAARGALILGVCGGYQLLGHGYRTRRDHLPGLGLLDLHTVNEPGDRLIGNVAIRIHPDDHDDPDHDDPDADELGPDDPRRRTGPVVVGFENHGGRTYLGDVRPLGRVLRGHGNNGKDRTEGARDGVRGNILGTYLHGPLLAGNPWLADRLIAEALRLDPADLPPLDDTLENAGHAAALRAAGVSA